MKDTTKKYILNCTLGLTVLVSVVLLHESICEEITITPSTVYNALVVAEKEEIVTGLCTFGDCPVATLPTTEMSFANKTEPEAEEYSTVDEDYSATEPVTEWDGFEVVDEKSATTTGGYIGTMYITGYTAEEGFPEGSATASGYGVRPGYCAMNDNQRRSLGISYGDQIYVEGLGTYTVMDCGCDWGVVDIWVYTNAEAYAMTGYYAVYYG